MLNEKIIKFVIFNVTQSVVQFLNFNIMIRREKKDEIKETKTTIFWETIFKEKIKPEDSNEVENYVEKTIIKERAEKKEIKKEQRPK